MKIIVNELNLVCKRDSISVPFKRFTYFYGQMGAGKTSIARLIDYCLGGELELTAALQNEFVSAVLHLSINDTHLSIERPRDANQVHAQWETNGETFDILLPAKTASGVVIPNTEVEVLSDLVFHLAGYKPPRVRKSKSRQDSELNRLSLRNLLWYCYIDQDTIDSSFFNLDKDANPFKRNASRDVLRFVIGFHQELVSELESQLQEIRENRLQSRSAATSLKEALTAAEVASEADILERVDSLEAENEAIKIEIRTLRIRLSESAIPHGADSLRDKARTLTYEIESIEQALPNIQRTIANDQRHINELQMLSLKFRRATSARAVLGGVEFEVCPRCTQSLPELEPNTCIVCGQDDTDIELQNADTEVIKRDAENRIF